ncbi:predicted protein [Postia placenta Mad-698-R]|nr:predicted protein [Postia placenta Mad-698-R]
MSMCDDQAFHVDILRNQRASYCGGLVCLEAARTPKIERSGLSVNITQAILNQNVALLIQRYNLSISVLPQTRLQDLEPCGEIPPMSNPNVDLQAILWSVTVAETQVLPGCTYLETILQETSLCATSTEGVRWAYHGQAKSRTTGSSVFHLDIDVMLSLVNARERADLVQTEMISHLAIVELRQDNRVLSQSRVMIGVKRRVNPKGNLPREDRGAHTVGSGGRHDKYQVWDDFRNVRQADRGQCRTIAPGIPGWWITSVRRTPASSQQPLTDIKEKCKDTFRCDFVCRIHLDAQQDFDYR